MSFICGLSTIATLIEPPPDPPPSSSSSPQAANTSPASRTAINEARAVALMVPPLRGSKHVISLDRVGCQGEFKRKPRIKPTLALGVIFAYSERDVGRSSPIRLGQARLGEIARGGIPVPLYDRARLRPAIVHVGVGGFH